MYNFFLLVQTFYCKNSFLIYLCVTNRIAQMAELVDALVSGTSDRKIVQVRVLFWAQKIAAVKRLFLCPMGTYQIRKTQEVPKALDAKKL